MLFQLFTTFFMIGLVSFGGGYAMIPLIQEEVVQQHQWMSMTQFTDVIAVAGMSPGPIATNIAIFIGYQQAGLTGALMATLGVTLPPLLIILVLGALFYKWHHSMLLQSALYGVRSIITGLIIYAAIIFALHNGLFSSFSWQTISMGVIYLASLVALLYFKIHPIAIILISGLVGIALYS